MNNELISVIIPVYNTPLELLKKSLYSVYNQTYQNIEIIVIDDGSEPKYRKKYQETLLNKGKNIKIINNSNKGVSESRNIGIEKSIGEYIMFLDSDDYISKDYISTLYNSIKKSNSKIAVTGATIVDNKGKMLSHQLYNLRYNEPLDLSEYIKELINYPYFTCVKMLIKKEIINISFNSKLKYGEDILFAFELFKNNKIVYLNNINYYYVQNLTSVSNNYLYDYIKKYLEDNLYVFNAINKYDKKMERIIKVRLFSKLEIALSRYLRNKKSKYIDFKKVYNEFIELYDCKKIKLNEVYYLSKFNKIKLILLNKKHLKTYYIINKIKKIIK